MNKFYLIVPTILLAAFIFCYGQFSQQYAAKVAQEQAEVARQAELDKEAKQRAAEKATEEARKLEQSQREADERAEAQREQEYQNKKKAVTDEMDKYKQEADSLSQQADTLQKQLDSLYAAHEQASRKLFNLQKEVERERIARRDADMEIQRAYEMVTQKVAGSSLANYTPPPAPAQ